MSLISRNTVYSVVMSHHVLWSELEKLPLKYRRAASLVTTDKLVNGQDKTRQDKQKLLDICTERGDQLGHVARDRILGAGLSDLHDLDARYHQKCCKRFHNIP